MKTLISSLFALSFLTGVAGTAMAQEYDNDRSTNNAKEFYEKLDKERGGQ